MRMAIAMAVMILTGCASAPAGDIVRDDGAIIRRPTDDQAVALAKRTEWVNNSKAWTHVAWLCSLRGTAQYKQEIGRASENYGIVPRLNPVADAAANRAGYATFDCPK
jgi:hypothetical protein